MNSKKIVLLFLILFSSFQSFSQEKFTLSGTITDANSNETLIGVNVTFPELKTGLPIEYGYISGHSKILDSLKEISIIVDDLDNEELNKLASHSKVIHSEYVNLICTDLLHAQKIAPKIYDLFYSQYLRFSEIITLPQKFTYV